MAIIDDGSGNVELTGKHLKDYIKIRFPKSKESEKYMITSKVDELKDKIEDLENDIELLKQKLEYHKLG